MKYPDENTDSKPVVGAEADALLKAIDSGKSRTNEQAEATIARIFQNRKGTAVSNPNGQEEQICRSDVSSRRR